MRKVLSLRIIIPFARPFYLALFLCIIFLSGCEKTKDLKPVAEALSSSVDLSAATATKPNIVFILGDDIGHDIPTSFGGQSYETPNIDMIGQLGMRFTHVYSSPLCSPSRVAIMTGKYNFRNYDVWGVLNPAEKTFGNIMKNAGYATYIAGKWQLDGGDPAIHGFGFDDYSLWNPIKDGVPIGEHYKNPSVYEYAQFLPDSYTDGKYGDDIFTDRILNFIEQNKTNRFFVYFPITLCHTPFSPTPDDPEFAAWDTRGGTSDTSFFPSMVKYMDKKIGQIMDKLVSAGVSNNTVVIFVGDNGTPSEIYSMYNGQLVQGGKSKTNEAGTNVPMTIMWPNRIAAGQLNDNLIDFSDFLPTLADLAGTTVPSSYGIIDGKSFYKQLIGKPYVPRDWVFDHYEPNTNSGNDILIRWVQDKTYKLYDSIGLFFNIALDPNETSPIKSRNQTPEEKQRKKQFQKVLSTMHN